MGFSGKIEDLPILDIFQYLHAGCKSGTLKLTRENETAYVYLQKGNIVHAVSPQRSNIGDLLIESRDISLKALQKALVLQSDRYKDKPVGQILVEMGEITQERLKQVVLQQIEQVIYYLVSWREGEFEFGHNQMIPVDDINLNPTTLLPTSHLNTQHLLLDAVRILDETNKDRREKESAAPPQAPPTPVEARRRDGDAVSRAVTAIESRWHVGNPVPVVLMTEDGIFKNLLRANLEDEQLSVITPSTLEDGLSRCERLCRDGVCPIVLVEQDFSGTARRGRGTGLTVLKERALAQSAAPVVVIIEEMNPETVLELCRLGARAVLPKPRRDKDGETRYPEAVRTFGEALKAIIRRVQQERAADQKPAHVCEQAVCYDLLRSKKTLERIAQAGLQIQSSKRS